MAITYTTGSPTEGGIESVLAPGRYPFRVVEAKEKKSSAGNPMIEFKARVIKEDGTTGRAVYGNLVFTAKALWKVDQFVAACGRHPGEGQDCELDPDEMIGWEFDADVVLEQDPKGRDRNEFANFITANETGF